MHNFHFDCFLEDVCLDALLILLLLMMMIMMDLVVLNLAFQIYLI